MSKKTTIENVSNVIAKFNEDFLFLPNDQKQGRYQEIYNIFENIFYNTSLYEKEELNQFENLLIENNFIFGIIASRIKFSSFNFFIISNFSIAKNYYKWCKIGYGIIDKNKMNDIFEGYIKICLIYSNQKLFDFLLDYEREMNFLTEFSRIFNSWMEINVDKDIVEYKTYGLDISFLKRLKELNVFPSEKNLGFYYCSAKIKIQLGKVKLDLKIKEMDEKDKFDEICNYNFEKEKIEEHLEAVKKLFPEIKPDLEEIHKERLKIIKVELNSRINRTTVLFNNFGILV